MSIFLLWFVDGLLSGASGLPTDPPIRLFVETEEEGGEKMSCPKLLPPKLLPLQLLYIENAGGGGGGMGGAPQGAGATARVS